MNILRGRKASHPGNLLSDEGNYLGDFYIGR